MQKARLIVLLAVLTVSCDSRAVTAPESTRVVDPVQAESRDGGEKAPDAGYVATLRSELGQGAQVAAQHIGPEGGSVRLGDYEIVVPAGAVSNSTRFSIRLMTESSKQKHAWAEFSPHNEAFAIPVIVRLPHRSTDAEPGSPAAWWSGDAWVPQPTTATTDGRVQIEVDHFSVYATMRRGITMIGG